MQACVPYIVPVIEAAANGVLAMDADTAGKLRDLEGATVAVHLAGPDIAFFLQPHDSRVRVLAEFDGEPDARLRASPAALFANALDPEQTRAGRVHIEGDAHIARQVQKLLKRMKPDWEEPLAQAFGDVLGPRIAQCLRDGIHGSQAAAEALGEQVSEYLREESGHLVSREELDAFYREVDELRDAVDRLEARMRNLRGSSK